MFDPVIFECLVLHHNVLQQLSHGLNIPLAIGDLVDGLPLAGFRCQLEYSKKSTAGRHDSERFIQHDHGFPNGTHDVLNIVVCHRQSILGFLLFCDLRKRDDQPGDDIFHRTIGLMRIKNHSPSNV
jgi:hypothetical protein